MTAYQIEERNERLKLITTLLTMSLGVFMSVLHFKLQSEGILNSTMWMQALTIFTVLAFSFLPAFVIHVRPIWFLLLPVAIWDGFSTYLTFKYTSHNTLDVLVEVKSILYGIGVFMIIIIVGYLINYIKAAAIIAMDTTTEDRHRTQMDNAKKEAEKNIQEKILHYEKLSKEDAAQHLAEIQKIQQYFDTQKIEWNAEIQKANEKHAAQQKSLTVDYNNRISDLQNAVAIGVYYSIKYFATFKENISAKEINNKMPNPKAQDRIKFDFITSEYINIINTYCAKAFSPISSNIIHNS